MKLSILKLFFALFFFSSLLASSACYAEVETALLDDATRPSFQALAAYEQQVADALKSQPAVLNLLNLDSNFKEALELALKNQEFLGQTHDPVSKQAYRNEIFAVRPYRAGDLPHTNNSCQVTNSCIAVEMYNFTKHLTTYAVVHMSSKNVIHVRAVENMQPEIPKHLEELAIQIARETPQVKKQLGFQPGFANFVMAGTKTALNRTRCERSQHLCVSPTFVHDNKALWTIVDLEEGRVVGTAYTKWDESAPFAYTEQRLRDLHILETLCQKSSIHKQDGWKFSYQLTSSDGLEVRDVTFKGHPKLKSAKNVDWHVSYSDKEGFGYSDAVGCPLFSAAAVVPAKLPKIKEIKQDNKVIGFELHADFLSKLWPQPCNYYYEQRFQFFKDGRFRIAVASVGRGCGVPGIYRPVVRIEFPFEKSQFASWNGQAWETWKQEAWTLQNQNTKYTTEGYQFKIESKNGSGFYVAPGRGQFNDLGRGDNAFTYIVAKSAERQEGQQDLPTIGPCCNNDHHQGPDKFIEPQPESLQDGKFIMWYVPQLTNDGRPGNEYCWGTTELVAGKIEKKEFPCIAGPMFVPINKG